MSFFQAYRNLSPRARAGVGLGLLAWGAIGLQLSDRAEERFGLTPSDEDRAALAKLGPRITLVDRDHPEGTAPPLAPPPPQQQQEDGHGKER